MKLTGFQLFINEKETGQTINAQNTEFFYVKKEKTIFTGKEKRLTAGVYFFFFLRSLRFSGFLSRASIERDGSGTGGSGAVSATLTAMGNSST